MKTQIFTLCILTLAASTFVVQAACAQPTDQPLENAPDIIENKPLEKKFIAAAGELESLMAEYRGKIKAAGSEHLDALKVQMGRDARFILEKYGLSDEELARYRQKVEKATKTPLKDPAFRGVVDKLK